MNHFRDVHSPSFADFELLRPNAATHFPHSVECGSRWGTYGSSSSWSNTVISSAIGEQFERKHFYLDVPVHESGSLASVLTREECKSFIDAFTQTTSKNFYINLESHHFDLTRAYRLKDLTACKVPTACISIFSRTNQIDDCIYPIRDTCGCSTHITLENAMVGALKEAIERQFLLRFWLTKSCTGIINHDKCHKALGERSSALLLDELKKSGELCALDLSDQRFPGHCVLLCYGNSKHQHEKVRYCAGMSYASTLSEALEKSILELWQTFRFMQTFDEADQSSNIEDPYLKHFLSCNHHETYKNITSNILFRPRDTNTAPTPFNLHNLKKALTDLRLDGYLYISSTHTKHSPLYFCKYFSPHFFLHMNNSTNFNTHNTYSHEFSEEILTHQLSSMVPFP
ncbi:TPA: YcaO-like family protein [Pseudomonas putida]|nr:YcaO-like family protein [Pseudomonas putida]